MRTFGLLALFISFTSVTWAEREAKVYYGRYLAQLRKSQLPWPNANSVCVIGVVKAPGEVTYGDGITAAKAIALVGGVAKFGDSRHVGIWKHSEGRFVIFNLKSLLNNEPDAPDPILVGGDIVIVLERMMEPL